MPSGRPSDEAAHERRVFHGGHEAVEVDGVIEVGRRARSITQIVRHARVEPNELPHIRSANVADRLQQGQRPQVRLVGAAAREGQGRQ